MLASEIVARAVSGWPYDAVDYSQSGIWNDDDGPGPHIGGYRRDCSGFATMAGGGPTPGYSTVTMLSSGWVRPISWAELAPGDFVGALGPGTAGDAGHVMVVITVDHTANTYEVLEQAGYGPGPDRNTYRIGDGQDRNYLPYRLANLEDHMALKDEQLPKAGRDAATALDDLYGQEMHGSSNFVKGDKSYRTVQLDRIDANVAKLAEAPGGVDLDKLADLVVEKLAARLAE